MRIAPSERGRPSLADRLLGLIRLGHPFPSLLDGLATGALALVAGGRIEIAARLAIAMVALQVSIGAANDLADVDRDRAANLTKPIATGLVPPVVALVTAAVAMAIGLGLSWTLGPATLVVAAIGTAIGYAYDLWLKPTRWSWLPFALGTSLVPVYAWVGSTGGIPSGFIVLLPASCLAGTGLALANSLADLERDRAAGTETPATALGRVRTWRAVAVLQAIVGAAAIASLAFVGVGTAVMGGAAVGLGLLTTGVALARSKSPARRRRGWETSAVGLAALGLAWALGFSAAGML